MNIVTFPSIILGIVFFVLIIFADRGKKLFSPTRLYLLVYSGTLAITLLNLTPHSRQMSGITWPILILWTGSFILGSQSIKLFLLSKGAVILPHDKIMAQLKSEPINPRKFLLWIIAFSFIYLFAYLLGYYTTGLIPIFSDHPGQGRIDFWSAGSFAAFYFFGGLIINLAAMFLFSGIKKYRIAMYIIIACISVLHFFLLAKSEFAKIILFLIVLSIFFRGAIKLRTVLIFFISLIVIIFGMFFFREGLNVFDKESLKMFSSVKMRKGFEPYAVGYAYIAGNYWNLDLGLKRVFEGNEQLIKTYGYRNFHALFQAFKQGRNMDSMLEVGDLTKLKYQKVKGFNSIPYAWYFIHDFGLLGSLIGCFLFGAAVSFSYYYLQIKPGWWPLQLYGLFSWFVVVSFISLPWDPLANWLTLIASFFAVRFSRDVVVLAAR